MYYFVAMTLVVIAWIHNVLFHGHARGTGSIDRQCIKVSDHVLNSMAMFCSYSKNGYAYLWDDLYSLIDD